eukprot:11227069-Alexandrium_andersonii.AAC.1
MDVECAAMLKKYVLAAFAQFCNVSGDAAQPAIFCLRADAKCVSTLQGVLGASMQVDASCGPLPVPWEQDIIELPLLPKHGVEDP